MILISDMIHKNKEGLHRCKECGYQSMKRHDVFRHIEAHHMTQSLKCKFCSKVYNTSRGLQRHIRGSHFDDGMDIKQVMAWHLNHNRE
jgi:hypothetical protein